MVFVDFFSRENIFAKLLHFREISHRYRTFSLHSFSQKMRNFAKNFANCETFCSRKALSRSPKIKHTPKRAKLCMGTREMPQKVIPKCLTFLTFIGYRQTNKQTAKQSLYIDTSFSVRSNEILEKYICD